MENAQLAVIPGSRILAGHTRSVGLSPTLSLSQWAKANRAIDLTAGQLSVTPPEVVFSAMEKAVREPGSHLYGPIAGMPELREAVAYKVNCDIDREVFGAESVYIGNGAKGPLSLYFQVVLHHDLPVYTPGPAWPSYKPMVALARGHLTLIPTKAEDNYKVSAAELGRWIPAMGECVLLLVNPSNPTGATYSKEEMYNIAEFVRRRPNVLVVEDLIYSDLVYPEVGLGYGTLVSVAPDLVADGRLAIVGGVSKSHAMTGDRIGWILSGNQALVEKIIAAASHSIGNISRVEQLGALAALTQASDFASSLIPTLDKKRQLVHEVLSACPGITVGGMPGGAFFYFPNVSALEKKAGGALDWQSPGDHFADLLKEEGVAVVPGSEFGDSKGFRLSFAGPERDLVDGLMKIQSLAKRLVG